MWTQTINLPHTHNTHIHNIFCKLDHPTFSVAYSVVRCCRLGIMKVIWPSKFSWRPLRNNLQPTNGDIKLVIKINPVREWRSTTFEWLSSSHDLDLDLGLGHTAYHHASVIDLYLHTKFHWNQTNFFVDGLTTGTASSSKSRDTKTGTNIKNPVQSNLDIVL